MRAPAVSSTQASNPPPELSTISTEALLISSDRMYRLLDQDFPSPAVRGHYQDLAAELDARTSVVEAIPAGASGAGHP